jgi:hypothetical protein
MAEFEQYGRGVSGANKGDPARATATRAKFIEIGRGLVKKYPEAVNLANKLGTLIDNEADSVTNDNVKAAKLYEEAVNCLEPHFQRNGDRIDQYRAHEYIGWIESWDNVLINSMEIGKPSPEIEAQRNRVLDLAVQKQRWCTNFDSKDALLDVAQRRARLYVGAKRAADAVKLCTQMIEFASGAYHEKPYYYFLRNHFALVYQRLAEAYAITGEKEKEVRAWQEWLRIGVIPEYGLRFDALIKPDLPPTDENLKTLRDLDKELPGFKSFSLTCEVHGVFMPLNVYIPNSVPDAGFDPLDDQARYYKEERGVIFDKQSRDAVRRWSTLAHDGGIRLSDLIFNALDQNPLTQAEKALTAAQDELARVQNQSEENTKNVTAATLALRDAYLKAAERAIAVGNDAKLATYVEGAVTNGGAGPEVQSKQLFLQWLSGDHEKTITAWKTSWADEKLAAVIRSDLQRLSESSAGLDVLAGLRQLSAAEVPGLNQAVDQAWKAGRAKRLTDALAAMKSAEEAYARTGKFPERHELSNALYEATSEAIFDRRWSDGEAWLRKESELGFVFNESEALRAVCLIFDDKREEALKILRPIWISQIRDRTVGQAVFTLMKRLEDAGITHPDLPMFVKYWKTKNRR